MSEEPSARRRARRSGSLEAALASGWQAVRRLDVLVTNRLHDDPVTLAVWQRDRRIVYPARKEGAAKSAGAAPAAAPAAAASADAEPARPT